MGISCEFEEDAFQQQVDISIGRLTNISTTPGRVLENILGYDAAFYLDPAIHGPLLQGLAYFRTSRLAPLAVGVRVADPLWQGLANKTVKAIPPFKLNLFMQYKTPIKLIGSNAGEWPFWKKMYFRFVIGHRQRDILCRIEGLSQRSAMCCYASPAFIEAAALWKFALAGNIISQSHFVRANYLRSHDKYTYAEAKGQGRGCSEPEIIEPEDFEQMLRGAIERAEPMTFEQAIERAAKVIVEATADQAITIGTLIQRSGDGPDPLADLRTIDAFRICYGTRLVIVG